ncbi:DUF551 domain-containing protein [uncultured Kosakonia sp.]|uniref:DUF551 domain-containing protein n=1 Tax=uncultured Kosakonia sp. TaxID=1588927 RepID=UPI00259579B7|nr:DUF551 domain-containing protein [uncultured Kosakonia sp.]
MTAQLSREILQKVVDAADAVISALAGENEEVHKDDSTKMCCLWDELNDKYAPPEIVRSMARMLLAGMDSQPVAWTDEQELRDLEKSGCAYLFTVNPITPNADPRRVIKLYTAPPAPVLVPKTCTCSSGDGSLRWPCPAHPPASIAADQTTSKENLLQLIERGIDLRRVDGEPVTNSWIKCREQMPDAGSEQRVCAYTPSPHIDVRFRMVKASMFKQVCCDATHWQYMAAPEQEV